MKKWIPTALIIACVAGCWGNERREGSYKRWYHTRAKMLFGVAEEHLRVGQLDKARNKALEALSLAPDFGAASILLSKVYIEQGQYKQAGAELTKLREAYPENAEIVYLLAVTLEKQGQLDQALSNYRQAHALDETNLSAISAAGEVLVALNRIEEAATYIDGYLIQADSQPGLHELAGRVAMMRKRYDKAVEHFQRARDIDYGNNRYAEALGSAQFYNGKPREALETLNGLTQREGYVASALVHTMIGDCFMALGQPYKARDAYYRARDLKQDDPEAWVNIAKAALALSDEPRAILSAQQALRLDAQSLEASLLLAYAKLRGGRAEEAVAVLSKAAAIHPPNGTLQCLLGKAYTVAGDKEAGRKCYLAALSIEPGNVLARELLATAGTDNSVIEIKGR